MKTNNANRPTRSARITVAVRLFFASLFGVTKGAKLFFGAATLIPVASALAQSVSIFDSEFNPADWDLIVLASTAQSSATALQAEDGNGNPPPYMKITHSLGGGPPSTVRSIHIRKLQIDPRVQGAIE